MFRVELGVAVLGLEFGGKGFGVQAFGAWQAFKGCFSGLRESVVMICCFFSNCVIG